MTQLDTDQKDPETHAIIGSAMEVHRQLGPGFLELVYHKALEIELAARAIPAVREVDVPVYYKGHRLDCAYRPDFLCFGRVIVELKALSAITGVEEAQVLNYLKATGLECGLLLNFGRSSLQFKRFIFTNHHKSQSTDYRLTQIQTNF